MVPFSLRPLGPRAPRTPVQRARASVQRARRGGGG
jgi:hypothetical protein